MVPNELIKKIIDEQSQIIGVDLARSRALATGAISYSSAQDVTLSEEPPIVLDKLINSYKEIFGQASVDVCVDVIRKFPFQEISQYISPSIQGLVSAKKRK